MPSMKAFEEQPELFLRINERQNAFIMALPSMFLLHYGFSSDSSSSETHQFLFIMTW
jgi:hypothetical protein